MARVGGVVEVLGGGFMVGVKWGFELGLESQIWLGVFEGSSPLNGQRREMLKTRCM